MKIDKLPILKNIAISQDLFVLELPFSEPVQAGQFVMVNIPDPSKILPRPISVFNYDGNTLSLLIRKRGQGTILLSQLKQGDSIELFGILGKGFPKDLSQKKIVLMGGGEGIAPMLLASEQLKQHNQLSILAGFRYQKEAKILDYFDPNLSILYTAQDHIEQRSRGLITDLLQEIEIPDYIFCCGPNPMMKAIYHQTNQWNTTVYVSMESHMACGVGACMGCTVEGRDHQALKVCTEGPVFPAEEVFDALH
ncbi:MAG: dihydroorotate dehydrogenase electron transfer subunit [Brevinema sp.]